MASDCKKECDAPFCEEITVTKIEVDESCNEAWDQRGSAAPEYVSLPKVEIKIEEPCDEAWGQKGAAALEYVSLPKAEVTATSDSDSNDAKGGPTHACVPCHLEFGDANLLAGHSEHCPHRTPDSDEDVYDCVFCDEQIAGEASYRRHVGACGKRESPDGRYRCEKCPYATNTKRSFWRHGANHPGENGLFECRSCNMTFECRRGLSGHLRVHRKEGAGGGGFACAECGNRYRYRHNLVVHAAIKHLRPTLHRCDECGFETDRSANLKTHVQLRHRPAEKRHACADCDFATNTRNNLVRHVERCHRRGAGGPTLLQRDVKKYCCGECGYRTTRSSNLNAHVQAKHRSLEKTHECDDCEYAAHSKINLAKHVKRRHGKGGSCKV